MLRFIIIVQFLIGTIYTVRFVVVASDYQINTSMCTHSFAVKRNIYMYVPHIVALAFIVIVAKSIRALTLLITSVNNSAGIDINRCK